MWINNTSLFCDRSGEYSFLAHRGLAQTFDVSKVEWDTNTAEIIDERSIHIWKIHWNLWKSHLNMARNAWS